MIAMRVRAHDRRDTLTGNSAQDRLDMPLAIDISRIADAHPGPDWARVDYRDIGPCAHQPGLRTRIGVRRGIGREHAAHEGFVLLGFASFYAIGPVAHEMAMAQCRAKKKGRFAKTAPTGLTVGFLANYGNTGAQIVMFNTHSARTGCYAYGLAPPVLAFSP